MGEAHELCTEARASELGASTGASTGASIGTPTVTPAGRRGWARRLAPAVLLLAVALAACTATQPAVTPGPQLPGFWHGLWQGFIAPITFIVSLFTDGLRIYAFPNAGRWYDFGFMLGIGGFSGGAFAGFRRRR